MSIGAPIEKQTVKAVHAAKSALSLREDAYRELLKTRYGARSSTDLTEAQGKNLVRHLNNMRSGRSAEMNAACFPCRPRGGRAEDRPDDSVRYPITPKQEAVITQLRINVKWQLRQGFIRWLLQWHKTPVVRDSLTAGKVIAGLRGICASQHGCRACGDGSMCPRAEDAKTGRTLVYGPKLRGGSHEAAASSGGKNG
jgi:hypothetical protein